MRLLLLLWALPLGLFWGWYFLSFHDINFGYLFLSRLLHDTVFRIYGDILGIEPELIPGMVAKACVIDTGILLLILAWRRRKPIRAWIETRRKAGGPRRVEVVTEADAATEDGRERLAG